MVGVEHRRAAALPGERAQLAREVVGIWRPAVIEDEWRLEHGDLRDVEASRGGVECKSATKTSPYTKAQSPVVHDCSQVLDLAGRRVGLRVTTVAATASVVPGHGELPSERVGKLDAEFVPAGPERVAHEHSGRPVAGQLIGNPRAVRRLRRGQVAIIE